MSRGKAAGEDEEGLTMVCSLFIEGVEESDIRPKRPSSQVDMYKKTFTLGIL